MVVLADARVDICGAHSVPEEYLQDEDEDDEERKRHKDPFGVAAGRGSLVIAPSFVCHLI